MIKKVALLFIGLLPILLFAQPKNGMRAINFTLESPNGKKISLSDYKGKIVLLDFWASWCAPCRKENPNVVQAYEKFKKTTFTNGKGFEVLSVSLDKAEEPWIKAIKKDKLSWKGHVWDKNSEVTMKYNVQTIPHAFLIDGEGNIIAQGHELRGIGLIVNLEKYIE